MKAKQFDDRLYAAVELAAQQGAGRFAGKAMLLASMAGTLAVGSPTRAVVRRQRSTRLARLANAGTPDDDLLALDEALHELEQHDAQTAQLVKLRYFSGLGHQQAAEALGITRRVADRLWAVAKAWLYQRLQQN